MGRNLRWSIIAASEDQHFAGRRHSLGSRLNTSELFPKITEAHSVSKMQAQGIVGSMLKGLTSARAATAGGHSR
jgi:hypothetical protein